ncbi:MAG: hypothetical protein KDJ18_00320 [Hyphomicrobiaceae bacterium]|nr:hypothetical protein [Hyphomicrobiaceae bacterium]
MQTSTRAGRRHGGHGAGVAETTTVSRVEHVRRDVRPTPGRAVGPQQAETFKSEIPRPHFVDRSGRAAAFLPSHDLLRLMAAIPRGASAVFTPEHLAALDVALAQTRPRRANHRIDFRVSVPLLGTRWYFVLLGGKERRSRSRVASDGQNAAWRLSIAYAALMCSVASASMIAMILVLYVIKSALGIDIFPEHSILHGIFF